MLFYTFLSILLLGASAFAQQQQLDPLAADAAVDVKNNQDEGTSITVTELDTSEPMLWQMAAYAARQMSTKQQRFKLATLSSAEQIDSLYRLKVTLQRVNQGKSINKNVSVCFDFTQFILHLTQTIRISISIELLSP